MEQMKNLEIQKTVLTNTVSVDETDKFVSYTIGFIQASLKHKGRFLPMSWLLVGNDMHIYTGNITENAQTKTVFAKHMKDEAKKLDAWGYAFASEAWMVVRQLTKDASKQESEQAIKDAEKEFAEKPVSEHDDKVERMMFNLELKNRTESVMLSMDKDADGIIQSVILDHKKADNVTGRMINILS